MSGPLLGISFGVIIGALISEDAALFGSLALYKQGTLPLSVACAAPAIGIVLGDFGLFFLGISVAKLKLSNDRISGKRSQTVSAYLKEWGNWGLFLARFVPGTRLPAYLGAGLLQFPSAAFAAITLLSTTLWVALSAVLITHTFSSLDAKGLWEMAGGFTLVGLFISHTLKRIEPTAVRLRVRVAFYQVFKLQYYEFWPAWFFYIPVGAYYFLLGIRNLDFSLPLYANPGIPNGGIIGESKSFILSQVPDWFSAKLRFIKLSPRTACPDERIRRAKKFLEEHRLAFPVILKPDVGQRGSGVVLIRDQLDLDRRLDDLNYDAILQEYCGYSEEIGVNYLRRPDEPQGRIVGITRKRFPSLVGDGKRTLAELIVDDERARYLAPLYFGKHMERTRDVIPRGEAYVLAQIGNHCQGTIFEDGRNLASRELESQLDEIAQSIPGFFVGRFDIRFEAESSVVLGSQLKIIEINGAAGEATHIYDRKIGLLGAYRNLFEQLRILFKLGLRNKRALPELETWFWRDLSRYRELQKQHPSTT